ncbi:hypothetical protein [Sphaerisporangium corydalis]|uniref:Uncharacterized protein n=1 Tax=Sphaerisporangium corydalis TaxID=1441875 RepID=A0ABV9E9F4_9ACTN|nr:hypothetical protein [Sphaerisporangium corydalis]
MNVTVTRRILAVSSAAVLVSLASACGGGSAKASCEGAMKAFQDYTTQMSAATGDLGGINKAGAALATRLNELSGQADGELKTTLADLSTTWSGLKIDASDPAAAAAKLPQFATKASEATQKLASACS